MSEGVFGTTVTLSSLRFVVSYYLTLVQDDIIPMKVGEILNVVPDNIIGRDDKVALVQHLPASLKSPGVG